MGEMWNPEARLELIPALGLPIRIAVIKGGRRPRNSFPIRERGEGEAAHGIEAVSPQRRKQRRPDRRRNRVHPSGIINARGLC